MKIKINNEENSIIKIFRNKIKINKNLKNVIFDKKDFLEKEKRKCEELRKCNIKYD